ncbi:MAG TPA: GIY-YIG nuclease family protein [Candidatus Dojkabacteria bacterium]|nr:GIY-YIG nuclease family protein [Candidatus Dojkabacteria bacterium]
MTYKKFLGSITNKLPFAIPLEHWESELNSKLYQLLTAEKIEFSNLTPSKIVESGGVYIITDSRNPLNEIPFYIGRTKNLRQRIYTNHLMGGLGNARLKKYLVNDPVLINITDKYTAKSFIRENCSVRWITEEDFKQRGYFEGYFTGMLKPQFGVYEEH